MRNVMTTLFLMVLAGTLYGAEEELQVKETPWCTLQAPKSVGRGEAARVRVTIKKDAIAEDSVLYIDVHKFVGRQRKPGAGRAKPVRIKAGEAGEYGYTFRIPEDASAIAFVCYVIPRGKSGWKERSHSASIGVRVKR
ncbi:MAG: hypothetical protein D6820_06815 [Lentisphaerae bacterium]|nr:MAG: hypothetical protein D6820_06815 [Lentisphaerota bacterium]